MPLFQSLQLYNFDEWKKLLAKPSFKKCFPKGLDDSEVLSRPPKGYAEDNPAITFLKRKSFVVMYSFSDKEILDKTFLKKLGTVYAATQPLIDFLNRAID